MSTLPAARAVSADDGVRVNVAVGAEEALLDATQARALAADLLQAASLISESTTPAVHPYTAYAKSLCPDWCAAAHDVPADGEVSAVLHVGHVGTVEVADLSRADLRVCVVDVDLTQYDDLTGDSLAASVVVRGHADQQTLRPDDAAQLALLLFKAAETARQA